jgi:hypothetical protein
VIAAHWVLTAALCFVGVGDGPAHPAQWVVRGGGVHVVRPDGSGRLDPTMRVFGIDRIVIDPAYKASSDIAPPLDDLALVHLRLAPRLDPPTGPQRFAVLPLVNGAPDAGEAIEVFGWGSEVAATGYAQVLREAAMATLTARNIAAAELPMAQSLQKVSLRLVDVAGCEQAITRQVQLTGAQARNLAIESAAEVALSSHQICAGDPS